jgi:hypothetical protein
MGDRENHDHVVQDDEWQDEGETSKDVPANPERPPAPTSPQLPSLRVGGDQLERAVHFGCELESKIRLARLVPDCRLRQFVPRLGM